MKRTQVYLTEDQDHRLGQIAKERGISRAGALRWALDAALDTGDPEAEARAVILATAGMLSDYPDWPEWQRSVRGQTAAARLDASAARLDASAPRLRGSDERPTAPDDRP